MVDAQEEELDLSLEDNEQQEQSVDTAQAEPSQEQPQQQTQQAEIPETLKKFVGDNGQIDFSKMQQSYIETEKQLGKKNQELGDLRRTLLQSQVQQPQYTPPQQQPYTPETRDAVKRDISKYLSPDMMLTEGDINALAGLIVDQANSVIESRDRQYEATKQQQQSAQAQQRWNAVDRYTESIIRERDIDSMQEAEMVRLLKSGHNGHLQKIYNYAVTGQGLDDKEVNRIVDDLVSTSQESIKQNLSKKYGVVDPSVAQQLNNAMKNQAAQSVASPMGSGGTNNNANLPDFMKNATAYEKKMFKDFGLLD